MPALERLAPLWPSVPRQVTGSATVELESPDLGFGTYQGRLGLQVATAELLGGRLSLRDVSADVPVRQGGATPPAGVATDGPLKVGELVGFGIVLYDVSARARAADQRLTLTDLRYGLYSGEGRGTVELELPPAGPTARARITGERVRIDEFMAAYGVHGGTMTGLLRYDLDMRYGGGRFGADGQLECAQGGTVTIELLDRLLSWAEADPTGVVRTALGNLRSFDYKAADLVVRTEANEDAKVTLSLKGREILGIFPPRVKEINVIEHADRVPGEAVPWAMRPPDAKRLGKGADDELARRPSRGGSRRAGDRPCGLRSRHRERHVPTGEARHRREADRGHVGPERVRAARRRRPPAPSGGRSVDVASTPRLNERSPEVMKATESRRERRPALREWKNRGCIGETNQGLLVARPGEGCGPEVADLIRAENADRQVIYGAFMKENNIPASDTARVQSAFAKARQERSRPNDWIQLENGQWVRKT